MMKRTLLILCLLSLMLITASCETNSNDSVADGDSDAESDLDIIVLKMGGSNDGGNAIEVFLAFDPILVSSAITWSEIEFGIHSVGLPKSPACGIADSVMLASETGPFSLDVINEPNLNLKMLVPPELDFCSMNVLLNTSALAFHAEGVVADKRRIVIDTTFSGLFGFTPKEGQFRWQADNEYQWLAALDVSAMLPLNLIDELEPDSEGVLRIDAEHNVAFIVQVEESISRAMMLVNDSNRNGVADEEERRAGTQIGDARSCVDTCLESGGDESTCRERCFAPNDSTTGLRACYMECMDNGGEEIGCRQQCADAGQNDKACRDSANDTYEGCIENGDDEITCRERAGEVYEECLVDQMADEPISCDDAEPDMPCCGDDVCDGPETADNCAVDCS